MTNEQIQTVVDRLKEANNVLVTVNSNPSVDQLAACIGVTLALNKAGKHATAVFSGEVPSTLEFLQPAETLEKNTDSLRDFIISLDKSKADKLRYKVEDNVVKIFITPYRTAISEKDFDYSQGDFNVEVVLALGVRSQQDLDQVITAHGRIFHDATVVTMNTEQGGELGTVNVTDTHASSLSELATMLLQRFDETIFDNQIATALLTGIVAETERFRNDKTTPDTMNVSSVLMAAGANQQLVATQLEEPPKAEPVPEEPAPAEAEEEVAEESPESSEPPKEPGVLEIGHDEDAPAKEQEPAPEEPVASNQIDVDEDGELRMLNTTSDTPADDHDEADKSQDSKPGGRMMLEPPTLPPVNFTANSEPEPVSVAGDITLPPVDESSKAPAPGAAEAEEPSSPALPQITHHNTSEAPEPFNLSAALAESAAQNDAVVAPQAAADSAADKAAPAAAEQPETSQEEPENTSSSPSDTADHPATLAEIEHTLHSPHEQQAADSADKPGETPEATAPTPDLDSARKAVESAVATLPVEGQPLPPVAALNADTFDLHTDAEPVAAGPTPSASIPEPTFEEMPAASAADQPMTMPQPQFAAPPAAPAPAVGFMPASMPAPTNEQVLDPNAPPPVPPPMMPTAFGAPRQ